MTEALFSQTPFPETFCLQNELPGLAILAYRHNVNGRILIPHGFGVVRRQANPTAQNNNEIWIIGYTSFSDIGLRISLVANGQEELKILTSNGDTMILNPAEHISLPDIVQGCRDSFVVANSTSTVNFNILNHPV